jgi:NAD(P)-dependent dehydrogenase (short-subunit alcohol dehydrogenase family)
VLAARNEPTLLEAVARRAAPMGAQAAGRAHRCVSTKAQCRALIDACRGRFGGIDALINNAGMSAQALFSEVKAEDLGWYEELMRINLWGSVWCTHAALPHLKASRGQHRGRVVAGRAGGGAGAHSLQRHQVRDDGFFEALRAELKNAGVSVTTAYPGVVATQIRHRGFNAAGQAAGRSGLKEDDAMSVEECAQLIIAAWTAPA